MKFKIEHLILK